MQIAAAITGDRRTAEATNCTARTAEQGKADLYGIVANQWAQAKDSGLGALAAQYGRSIAKYAVMLVGYGAGKLTLMGRVDSELEEHNKSVKWNEYEEKVLMDALEAHCGASLEIKATMQEVAANANEGITWTTHDGFVIVQEKQSGDKEEVGKFAMEFDLSWDESDNITAASPNFVHSLDAAQMREAVRILDGVPVACIHDSLGVRAGDYTAAAQAVRVAFTRINGREILAELAARHDAPMPSYGDYRPEECLKSSYFWC
jgi:hypothetical protein